MDDLLMYRKKITGNKEIYQYTLKISSENEGDLVVKENAATKIPIFPNTLQQQYREIRMK